MTRKEFEASVAGIKAEQQRLSMAAWLAQRRAEAATDPVQRAAHQVEFGEAVRKSTALAQQLGDLYIARMNNG